MIFDDLPENQITEFHGDFLTLFVQKLEMLKYTRLFTFFWSGISKKNVKKRNP